MKYFTVVFNVENWSTEQLAALIYNPDVRATSWGHSIQESHFYEDVCKRNDLIGNEGIVYEKR